MHSTYLAIRCSLAVALVVCFTAGASTHLRARATARKQYAAGSACQFVAHQHDDSEAVLSVDGPQVLFRRGQVAVVEKTPMRYLVSFADDGSCNEQAEQVCNSVADSSQGNTTGTGCDAVACAPEGNGDTLLSYLRSMVGGALALRPAPSQSAVIGLGSGAMASWLGRAFPDGSVDAVDLDADVIAASKCFGLQSSPQVRVVESEGRRFLLGAKAFAYDVIFLDAFDAGGSLPPCLATTEFFNLVAQKLAPDQGVLAVNLGARDEPGPVLAAIQKAFMHVAVGTAPKETNHLVLASNTEITFPSGDSGTAELLSPGSIAANLTRWARQASYHMEHSKAKDAYIQDLPRTDAMEGCKDAAVES